MKPTNLLVGSPIERLEDPRLLRGRGQFVDDLTRAGVLHAAILRSSVAHGRVRSIDTWAARALPGVHAIITAADIGEKVPIIPMRLQRLPELEFFSRTRSAVLTIRCRHISAFLPARVWSAA
jgi:carbon-monoxide dehydrogenase large subunit